MTLEENLQTMERCSRFEHCSIPKCPLDFWADERMELPEDKRCINWKYKGKERTKRMRGRLLPSVGAILNNVRVN